MSGLLDKLKGGDKHPFEFHVSLAVPPAEEGQDGELLGAETFAVRSLELHEELHAPFSLTTVVVTEQTLLDVDRLVGARFELDISRKRGLLESAIDADDRRLHGVVLRADYLGTHSHRMFVRLVVGPALSLLSLTRRSRIFQEQTVVQIVEAVVKDLFSATGRKLVTDKLAEEHPVRDYCVQSRETDLDFIDRILAEAGIFYVWDHDGDAEAMVLLDANDTFSPLGHADGSAPPMVPVITAGGSEVSGGLTQLQWSRRARTAKHETSIWDWKATPPVRLSASVAPAQPDPWEQGEAYLHDSRRVLETAQGAGAFLDPTMRLAELSAARSGVEGAEAEGVSNLIAMTPGATFECEGHPNPHLEREFAVIAVTHRVEIAAADMLDGGDDLPHYVNEFRAIPLEQTYRPALRPKPRIAGPQLGTVVGPVDEEIHTDTMGRVKVWLHWDREGEAAQTHDLTCFLRVAQMWAGPGYGTFFLPRVGMEVVVAFLDGDPDQPLVTGCVYNGEHPPPYAMPDERTKSTIKTATSPGGVEAGFNELRFEDAKGREQIYVHAQRNLKETIRVNHTTTVGVNQTLTVKKDRSKTVKGDEERKIEGNRNTNIGGSTNTIIAGSRVVEVGCAPAEPGARPGVCETRVLGEKHVYADELCYTEVGDCSMEMTPEEVTLKASKKLEIQVGNTVLTITPEKIWAATQVAEVQTTGSTLLLDDNATLKSSNYTVVKQGVAALQLKNNRARLKSRGTKLEIMTSPTAARIELGDNVDIKGKSVIVKPTEGLSELRVNKSSITSYSETADHKAGTSYKIVATRIDLN